VPVEPFEDGGDEVPLRLAPEDQPGVAGGQVERLERGSGQDRGQRLAGGAGDEVVLRADDVGRER
jgi:hypothetical protein